MACYVFLFHLKVNFDVLLTVYLSIFILVINELDAQNFLFYNKFISCLYMFRAHVLIIRSILHYTATGIIIPIGVHLVHVHRLIKDYLSIFILVINQLNAQIFFVLQ